jgi:hypothetical protein
VLGKNREHLHARIYEKESASSSAAASAPRERKQINQQLAREWQEPREHQCITVREIPKQHAGEEIDRQS